jgi:hypothetical protein
VDQADAVEPQPLVPGVILTSIGTVDARLAALYDLSEAENEDEGANDSAEDSVQEVASQEYTRPPIGGGSELPVAVSGTGEADSGTMSSATRTPPTPRTPVTSTPIVRQQGLRSSGRPRSTRRDPIPTVESPDGPTLQRDPRRAEGDAREVDENQNLNVASNRLGGQDLRVF